MTTTIQTFGESVITKAVVTVTRFDGSQARITTQGWANVITGNVEISTFVHARPDDRSPWVFCSTSPQQGFKLMSRLDYIVRGRSAQLQAVTAGELLKVVNLLGEPHEKAHGFSLNPWAIHQRDRQLTTHELCWLPRASHA